MKEMTQETGKLVKYWTVGGITETIPASMLEKCNIAIKLTKN